MAYSACLVPPGSENMANDHEGSPGTWETLPSPSKCRPETRLTNSRWIHGPVSWAVGDERGTQRWYRQAKETKCGERDVRSRSAIVPSSRGNHPEGPRGGKEAPSHEPLEGNMIGTPRPATAGKSGVSSSFFPEKMRGKSGVSSSFFPEKMDRHRAKKLGRGG